MPHHIFQLHRAAYNIHDFAISVAAYIYITCNICEFRIRAMPMQLNMFIVNCGWYIWYAMHVVSCIFNDNNILYFAQTYTTNQHTIYIYHKRGYTISASYNTNTHFAHICCVWTCIHNPPIHMQLLVLYYITCYIVYTLLTFSQYHSWLFSNTISHMPAGTHSLLHGYIRSQ